MASVVDICNLALGRLGDNATLSSIDPPEGSAQAEHCARFYPIARDSMLDMHSWGFATKRITLAQVATTCAEWDYAYAMPSDALGLLGVLDPASQDDYSTGMSNLGGMTQFIPQPYQVETDALGNQIILTDLAGAQLRYSALVSDTSQFSPLFTDSLAWLLASYLAGPVIKGMEGIKIGQAMMQTFTRMAAAAIVSDANQRVIRPAHLPSWINGR